MKSKLSMESESCSFEEAVSKVVGVLGLLMSLIALAFSIFILDKEIIIISLMGQFSSSRLLAF